ncbi:MULTISPECIES: hypothetical protein [unclassified Pedobacter]|uniref:hypothetical protein n=1 Tax=unclassified Pedobacter TaxID=2628915 RepID=UPI001DDE0432|nr:MULTISPECIES: hypothetical protein [unclassified Pedobacter]CAH0304347.1 hypothetical protein SRABI36_04755 [Pedobacter sp. Bi36]CAH0313489.1 hypothetical protein SRABI126_04879 [Pedobacter sp. Bi126]
MKIKFLSLALVFMSCSSAVFSQQVLGDFTNTENFEWPKVIWQRDIAAGWDEGLIKTSPSTSGVARSGFGIHMHESRQFSFWSTNLQPLLTIEGGSGNTYIKGKLGLGTYNPQALFDMGQTLDGGNLGMVFGRMTEGNNEGSGTFLGVRGYETQNAAYSGKGFSIEHNFYGVTNSSINFYRGSSQFGGFITFSTNNNTEQLRIDGSGNVGIGTISPRERLSVNGNIRAKEIKVEATNWPDFVFKEEYQLPSLKEVEKYIKANKHLPEIPSAAEIEKDGVQLGEMNRLLLKKIEELTLHVINLDKKMTALEEENKNLKKK